MKKSAIIVAIVFMMIGFASISTTLIINSNIKVSENETDFDVYFSKARLDTIDIYESVISQDKKTITFNTNNLSKVGDKSTLTYEVTNNSANYDAEVQVNCNVKENTTAKYTSITNELENNATVVKSKTSLNGTLTVTLNKTSTEEIKENYVCTLTFNAIEREKIDQLNSNYILTKMDGNASRYAEVGDSIGIGNENFYVISNNNHNVAALAYYNLYVGDKSVDGTIGIQNINAQNATVAFSNNIGWEYSKDNDINLKSYSGPVYDALYGDNGYEKYVKSLGLDAEIRLITKNELDSLGCSSSTNTCSASNYSWLLTSPFWTETSYHGFSNSVWSVYTNGYFVDSNYAYKDYFGVRPVIVFSENI